MAFRPTPRSHSIWGTLEMDAASRDFSYADYCWIHQLSNCPARLLSEANYSLVCQILNNSMLDDMARDTPVETQPI